MTLSILPFTGTLRSDEEMLHDIQDAILTVATAGQAYTLFGSRTVTHADLTDLQSLESIYRRRILAANGYNGRNTAQFFDSASASNTDGTV